MERRIDLNCDMAESFGTWTIGDDAAVMPHVTSTNVACGFHAGDPTTMQRTVALALSHGVAIGAHPSLPDLQGFGRRRMAIGNDEAYALVVYQIGALDAFVRAAGARLHHVKLHGALYNMAYRDSALADAVANAIADVDRTLVVYAQSGGALIDAANARGLRVAAEVFADRRYAADGALVPRTEPGSVIASIDDAVAQAVALARDGTVVAQDGSTLRLRADTICVHGDKPDAASFARRLRRALDDLHIAVRAPDATRSPA